MNAIKPRLKEKIEDSGHKYHTYVSQIWNESQNLVIESHYGKIIEVYRNVNDNKLYKK